MAATESHSSFVFQLEVYLYPGNINSIFSQSGNALTLAASIFEIVPETEVK
jgi:hypothetical protein